MSKSLSTFILFCLLNLVSGLAPAFAADDPLVSRMQNMQRLLNESSGARQVMDGNSAQAKQKREQALDLYSRAADKIAAGARDEASGLLDSSAKLMFEAIKLATPSSMLEEKQKVDYGTRKESVMALRDAFYRISDETSDTESRQKIDAQLTDLVGRADAMLAKGDNDAAQAELDKAYHLLKISIESKRAGQTLVRSLNFESKEEEFHYEIDRNETHRMLVDLLVDEKNQATYARDQVVKFVDQALQLRKQADAYAGEGEYELAIDLLEQSTRELVRAIRSAGIYIPG
jgi:tetratricopeptide (TPR) repeat protein